MAHKRREVSRIEGLSDGVFAFAITLLVVSLEVPKSFTELLHVMQAFPAFAVSFALLFQIWWRQYRFFRRYDLEDTTIIVLTAVLLFVVLFFVYPLKFLWSLLFSPLSGAGTGEERITLAQLPTLFYVYGAGVVATYGLLAAMYAHASRATLELTQVELLEAREDVYRNLGLSARSWRAEANRFWPEEDKPRWTMPTRPAAGASGRRAYRAASC